jgi:hypothetical protein
MFGKKRPRDQLEGVNLLELAPVRLASWQEKDGRVVLERPRPSGRGVGAWWDRVSHALSARRIRLDAVGSFAWKRLDGRSSVAQVARELRQEFGDDVEPAEERLGLLVRQLRGEGFLAYPGWDRENGESIPSSGG